MPEQTPAVDWARIGARMADEMRKMLHEENWHGPDQERYAVALQRALGFEEGEAPRPARLRSGMGLTTDADADWTRGAHTVADRMAREAAEKRVAELREEVRRVYREAAQDLAAAIRERCNERSVPSRFRREGVAWAADLIDPSVPKDQFGNVRQAEQVPS